MLTDGMADFSPVELLELFQRAQATFTDRVDAVGPGQWEDEALPGWTVADLVAHLVSEQLWAPPLLAGEPYAEGRFPDDTGDLLGDGVRERVFERSHPLATTDLEVIASPLGADAGLLGAAQMAADEALSPARVEALVDA